MARWIRFLGKKRGERRTGSRALGRAGLGLFSAIFFAGGVISLTFIVLKLSIPEWRVNHRFIETTCRVLDSRAGAGDEGMTRPEIEVEYSVNGQALTAWSHHDITGVYQSDARRTAEILAEFEPGQQCVCWYDPRQPDIVVLARGYSWFAWLMLLLPAAFISIGGGGLIYTVLTWGKSTERLAATAQRPPGLEFLLHPHGIAAAEFPFVPDPQDLNDSPGTTLAYRLPPGTGGWSLLAGILVCVFWNGVVAIFVGSAVQSFRRGEPDWFLTVFVIPFVVIGLVLLGFVVRQLMIETGVGPTLVEISAHPLIPGKEYEIFMSQAGRLAIESLELKLTCEEVATYRQGTNTRRAARCVYDQVLVSRESLDLRQGLPFEARARVPVPADAMHSFKASHNRIDWKIVVKGAVARWPNFERSFPVVVRPASAKEPES